MCWYFICPGFGQKLTMQFQLIQDTKCGIAQRLLGGFWSATTHSKDKFAAHTIYINSDILKILNSFHATVKKSYQNCQIWNVWAIIQCVYYVAEEIMGLLANYPTDFLKLGLDWKLIKFTKRLQNANFTFLVLFSFYFENYLNFNEKFCISLRILFCR